MKLSSSIVFGIGTFIIFFAGMLTSVLVLEVIEAAMLLDSFELWLLVLIVTIQSTGFYVLGVYFILDLSHEFKNKKKPHTCAAREIDQMRAVRRKRK